MAESHYLKLTDVEGVTIVDFSDATVLDAYHIDRISKELYELSQAGENCRLILDLATIRMLSSQTLGVFINMRKKMHTSGGRMVFAGVDPRLYRVFKVTNLQDMFEFFEDRATALAAMIEDTNDNRTE